MRKMFEIEVEDAESGRKWEVFYPSSINQPKDHSVMFIGERYAEKIKDSLSVSQCIIFWPDSVPVTGRIRENNLIYIGRNPRLEYARFFQEHGLDNLPQTPEGTSVNGSFLARDCVIGENVTIMPGAYVGEDVRIGNDVYIGCGVKITGRVFIGDHVTVRENVSIGADGLSMEREADGRMIPIPQFGGVVIKNNVIIGANSVIARGAIDDTVIEEGCMIDNGCFISHNTRLMKNVAVVGESILFGSVSVGENSFISGNVTIRDGVKIGRDALIGMGSVVTKDVESNCAVAGNPARVRY